MLDAETGSIKEGIRLIDTRHEQGAAYMAQAYSRVTQGPGVCMAASGPATLNLSTDLANALSIAARSWPLATCRRRSASSAARSSEIDQVKAFEGCVKYADRVHNLKRLPQQINFAFQKALNGKPGPAYLDFRGCALHQGRRGRRRLGLYGPADHQGAPLCRAQGAERAGRRDRRGAASRSSSRAAVSCGRTPGTR